MKAMRLMSQRSMRAPLRAAFRTSWEPLALSAMITIGASTPTTVVNAANAQVTGGAMQFVPLGIGKSFIVELPRDVKDVLVADPTIANAIVRSAQRAYIIGVKVGQTNVFFFDADGQQIAGYDIAVKRDLNGVRAAIRQSFPNSDIQIEGVNDGVLLTGNVSSVGEAQQIQDIAARLVGDPAKVVNSIVIRGRDQVMLKVTVAEVQRDTIKQLGINLTGSLNYGSAVLNFNNTNPFPLNGGQLVTDNNVTGTFNGVSASVRAMERAGIARTLAEPNLTAIGELACTFIAGGEFPIPKGYTCDAITQVAKPRSNTRSSASRSTSRRW